MAASSNMTKPSLCRTCQRRPADQPTRYHESIVDYSTTYMLARGRNRPHSVHKVVMGGTIQLCAQCAARYQRSVALRCRSADLSSPSSSQDWLGLEGCHRQ